MAPNATQPQRDSKQRACQNAHSHPGRGRRWRKLWGKVGNSGSSNVVDSSHFQKWVGIVSGTSIDHRGQSLSSPSALPLNQFCRMRFTFRSRCRKRYVARAARVLQLRRKPTLEEVKFASSPSWRRIDRIQWTRNDCISRSGSKRIPLLTTT